MPSSSPTPRPSGAALLLAALAACAPAAEEAVSAAPFALQEARAARVRVAPAERRAMERALETTTTVESERSVVVAARTSGPVVELLAEEGDEVEAGAVLARLDPRDAAAALEEARIALREARDNLATQEVAVRDAESGIEKARLQREQARADYERNQQARIISALEIEKLRVAMETAKQDHDAALLARDRAVIARRVAETAITRSELAVQRAELALSYTEIVAPFDGVVAERSVQVGDQVGPADPTFTVTDLSDLRTVFFRPQRELALFQGSLGGGADAPGGGEAIEVRATTEALPGREFEGRIERLSPSIDAVSGSFRVTVRLAPAPDGTSLLPGMLLRLRLVTERHLDALTVPKRALRREGETTLLFAVEDGRARRVEVAEGFSSDEHVEVTPVRGALEPGTPVVVVGNRDLEDGQPVEVSAEPDADATDGPEPTEAPTETPSAD
jgi:membrane fusion protein (multidrug efflux system)